MPDRDLQALRHEYESSPLRRADVDADPFVQLERWIDQAHAEGVAEPNAVQLATADADGRASVRTVLLRGIDHGLRFHSNRRSRKGRDLEVNPYAALALVWLPLSRQVTARGRVELLDDAGSDAYFAKRPRGSQVGAWASPQSEVIEGRDALDRLQEKAEAHFADSDEIPRPTHWGGYRLVPDEVELWQGRRDRLHDRLRYTRDGDRWRLERLAP